jgi:hypothetical protein
VPRLPDVASPEPKWVHVADNTEDIFDQTTINVAAAPATSTGHETPQHDQPANAPRWAQSPTGSNAGYKGPDAEGSAEAPQSPLISPPVDDHDDSNGGNDGEVRSRSLTSSTSSLTSKLRGGYERVAAVVHGQVAVVSWVITGTLVASSFALSASAQTTSEPPSLALANDFLDQAFTSPTTLGEVECVAKAAPEEATLAYSEVPLEKRSQLWGSLQSCLSETVLTTAGTRNTSLALSSIRHQCVSSAVFTSDNAGLFSSSPLPLNWAAQEFQQPIRTALDLCGADVTRTLKNSISAAATAAEIEDCAAIGKPVQDSEELLQTFLAPSLLPEQVLAVCAV